MASQNSSFTLMARIGFLITLSAVWWIGTPSETAGITYPGSGSPAIHAGLNKTQGRYKDGEVIVKFRDGASSAAIAAAHADMSTQTVKSFNAGSLKLHHLKLGKKIAVEAAIEKFRHNPAVEYAEPNYIYELTGVPNDPLFNQLWGLHNTGQTVRGVTGSAGADIRAVDAWDITKGSTNVIIAVIDTGIAYDHPDLAPNMWTNPGETPNDGIDNDGNGYVDDYFGYDFFNQDGHPLDVVHAAGKFGHGTSLAGTIAAAGNNGLGVTGVMQTAKIMALKAGEGWGGVGVTTATLLPAGTYAISKGARVINASFGRLGGPCSAAEYSLLSEANAAGIMVLAAAGNHTQDNDLTPFYPAQYSADTACGPALPNVIAVAATDQFDHLAHFSNYGSVAVQIASPGTDQTYSTHPTLNYTSVLMHSFDTNATGLGYTFSGINNSWGFTSSPPYTLADSPSGNYLNDTNSYATGPVFSTIGRRGCQVAGELRLDVADQFDGIQVQVSSDGGTTWTDRHNFSASTGGVFRTLPLGEVRDESSSNQFRIRFFSNASGLAEGVFIDTLRVECVSAAPSGSTSYAFLGGTSSATGHVTGVVGLLLSINPHLTVAQLRNAIINTGDVLPSLAGKTSTGRRLNARAALDSVSAFAVTVEKAGNGTGLVTSSPSGIHCGSTCNNHFPPGTSLELSATPTAGSVFSGWSGGGCAGISICSVSTTAHVTATFTLAPPAPFSVTVAKDGNGVGTVTSSPLGHGGGINCGSNCLDQFDQGTTVTLTATPAAGSVFSGWSGSPCIGTGTCQVSGEATVTATFAPAPPVPFTVTVAKNGNGVGTVTSSPLGHHGGINCGVRCTDQFDQGATVTLMATPAAGFVFSGWSGGNCPGTGSCQLTGSTTVTATFSLPPPPNTFTLLVTTVGTGLGTVTSTPAGINCGTTCSSNFQEGTTVTLTAVANPGSTFTGWSGGGCAGVGPCVVNTAATVTATFQAPVPSPVESGSGGGGGCTLTPAGTNDALMPILLVITLALFGWRARRRAR